MFVSILSVIVMFKYCLRTPFASCCFIGYNLTLARFPKPVAKAVLVVKVLSLLFLYTFNAHSTEDSMCVCVCILKLFMLLM